MNYIIIPAATAAELNKVESVLYMRGTNLHIIRRTNPAAIVLGTDYILVGMDDSSNAVLTSKRELEAIIGTLPVHEEITPAKEAPAPAAEAPAKRTRRTKTAPDFPAV